MKLVYSICILLISCAATFQEVVENVAECEEVDSSVCSLSQVSVTPCAEAASGKACKLRRGTSVNIGFKFTPNFDSSKLKHRAYSAGFIDLPMPGMNSDACQATTCPVENGKDYTYSYDLNLSAGFPTGYYNVKWRMWDDDDDEKECCVIIPIKLVR